MKLIINSDIQILTTSGWSLDEILKANPKRLKIVLKDFFETYNASKLLTPQQILGLNNQPLKIPKAPDISTNLISLLNIPLLLGLSVADIQALSAR